MIVGLCGYARSGKDLAANILVEEHGLTKIAFADPLREMLYTLDPLVSKEYTLKEVIDEYGWDGYKETAVGAEIRRLIQTLGTECGRKTISPNIWITLTSNRMRSDRDYVISDVRFDNEAAFIAGPVILITRPGVTPPNDHSSEKLPSRYLITHEIINDSTPEVLAQRLADVLY